MWEDDSAVSVSLANNEDTDSRLHFYPSTHKWVVEKTRCPYRAHFSGFAFNVFTIMSSLRFLLNSISDYALPTPTPRPLSVKRHHDRRNYYGRKHLTGGTVLEV